MADHSWLDTLFNGVVSLGVIVNLVQSFRVHRKIEQVHKATNGLQEKLVEATGIAHDLSGEKRGIEIGLARAAGTEVKP